jgi:hypothetical protein
MSSNHIYPYVYRLTHKETGQFYIGYRCANKVPAEQDLGHKYFTSSKRVKEIGFENFDSEIVAVFFSKHDAHAHEFELIYESISHPFCLNETSRISRIGPHTEETKLKMSAAHKGKVKTEAHRKALSIAKTGTTMPERSDEYRRKLSESHTGMKKPWATKQALINAAANVGRKHSEESKRIRSEKMKAIRASKKW